MSVIVGEAEPNGLASTLGSLLQQNLTRDPARRRLLRPAVVTLTATDAGVSVTLRIGHGRLEIVNGTDPHAHLSVSTDSHRLVELAAIPLRLGLPDVFTPPGRAVVASVLRGRLHVRGLLRHLLLLSRLNRLLSAA